MAGTRDPNHPQDTGDLSCIIRFRHNDNVGIALADLPFGSSCPLITAGETARETLAIPADQPAWTRSGGRTGIIPRYHKVATTAISRGAPVIKDGTAIGVATTDIRPGEQVDRVMKSTGTGLEPAGGNIQEYPNLYQPPAEPLAALAAAYRISQEGFDRRPALRPPEPLAKSPDELKVSVYPRKNGSWGSRNHILIIPSVFCVNQEAQEIADAFRDITWGSRNENAVIALPHQSGCCQTGFDEEVTLRTLTAMACHPNVGGVLVVTLGCSPLCVNDRLLVAIRAGAGEDVPVRGLHLQQEGRSALIAAGKVAVEEMIVHLRAQQRQPLPVSGLCLAVKCGASDPTSGLIANSAIGHMADWLLDRQGTVVISEVMEYFGAERILKERCRDPAVWRELLRIIKASEMIGKAVARAQEAEVHSMELTLGNIQAGLSTQEEKSLGAFKKMGFLHPIENVVRFGERITGSRYGLYIMDGPGQDLISASGLSAAGSQAMFFSTGIGTPLGNPVTPVIKITGNTDTFARHADFIDLCIPFDRIVTEGAAENEVAVSTLLPALIAVLEGKKTRAEEIRHRDFAIRSYTMVQ
ncbi:MAG: altronate dehydratase [Methanomicrobiales archaeon]|nr:altronate dehydratase [Methanomicrobiales archaeon]